MGSTTARVAGVVSCGLSLIATILLAFGCGSPPLGPSLRDVILENVTLQSTAGDASLCCCRAVATAVNQNAVAVDVTVKFSAFSGSDPIPLGTVVYFIDDMAPGTQQRVEASGFLFSCARITDVKSEIDVRGGQLSPGS